ncbi:hypothetical protein ACFL57_03430 [Candidatus Margulisiibacteriota bacterium]
MYLLIETRLVKVDRKKQSIKTKKEKLGTGVRVISRGAKLARLNASAG